MERRTPRKTPARSRSPKGKGTRGKDGNSSTTSSLPHSVNFKAYIRNIFDVNTLEQSFGIDLWMAGWTCKESRATTAFQTAHLASHSAALGHSASKSQQTKQPVLFDVPESAEYARERPVWHLNLQNAKDITYVYKTKGFPTVRVYSQEEGGGSFERQHVQCTVVNNLKLEEFPFDTQTLELTVSLDVSTGLAAFSKDGDISKDSASEKMLDETEWHSATSRVDSDSTDDLVYGAVASYVHKNETYSGSDTYSRLQIQIPVQRNPSSHVYTLMVPLFIVATSAFCALCIPRKDVGDRLSYLSTLLLTVFAFKWSAAEKLPKTRKPSFIIGLFEYAYAFISSVMLAGCFNYYYANSVLIVNLLVLCIYIAILLRIMHTYLESARKRRKHINFQRRVVDRDEPVSIHDALLLSDGTTYIYSTSHNGSDVYHFINFIFSTHLFSIPAYFWGTAGIIASLWMVVIWMEDIQDFASRHFLLIGAFLGGFLSSPLEVCEPILGLSKAVGDVIRLAAKLP